MRLTVSGTANAPWGPEGDAGDEMGHGSELDCKRRSWSSGKGIKITLDVRGGDWREGAGCGRSQ